MGWIVEHFLDHFFFLKEHCKGNLTMVTKEIIDDHWDRNIDIIGLSVSKGSEIAIF